MQPNRSQAPFFFKLNSWLQPQLWFISQVTRFCQCLISHGILAFMLAAGGSWAQWLRAAFSRPMCTVCSVTPEVTSGSADHARSSGLPGLTDSRWCHPETCVSKATDQAYFFERLCVLKTHFCCFCFLFVVFLRAFLPGPSLWSAAVTIVNWTPPSRGLPHTQ